MQFRTKLEGNAHWCYGISYFSRKVLKLNKCHLKGFAQSVLVEIRNCNMTVLSSYVTSIEVICYQIYFHGILTYSIFFFLILFKTLYTRQSRYFIKFTKNLSHSGLKRVNPVMSFIPNIFKNFQQFNCLKRSQSACFGIF